MVQKVWKYTYMSKGKLIIDYRKVNIDGWSNIEEFRVKDEINLKEKIERKKSRMD